MEKRTRRGSSRVNNKNKCDGARELKEQRKQQERERERDDGKRERQSPARFYKLGVSRMSGGSWAVINCSVSHLGG